MIIFDKNINDNIKKHIDLYGYICIKIFDDEYCKKLYSLFMHWLYSLDKRVNIHSWDTMPDQILGIIKAYGIGHSELMNILRRSKKIRNVFKLLFDIDSRVKLYSSK